MQAYIHPARRQPLFTDSQGLEIILPIKQAKRIPKLTKAVCTGRLNHKKQARLARGTQQPAGSMQILQASNQTAQSVSHRQLMSSIIDVDSEGLNGANAQILARVKYIGWKHIYIYDSNK